jgi:integrase
MPARRRFGKLRKLPSGRWQASYVGQDGLRHVAPDTFRTKTDADRWLASVETDQHRGQVLDETLGQRTLGEYAREVLRNSSTVGPRWRETCERNMRLHLAALLDLPVRNITPATVRQWHAEALRGNGGRVSIAQTYRLLRMVMNVAVSDGAILKNPCQIKGAGAVEAKERRVATPAQLVALVEAITPPKYRAAILIGGWVGLRRGEIVGLRREDVDLDRGVIHVRTSRLELLEAPVREDKAPKSRAGRRRVTIPPHVIPVLREHLDHYAGRDRVFVGSDGEPLRGNTLYQAFVRARQRVGLDWLTIHDLRHTGSTLAAQSGATLADLMLRLGHSTPAAAQRYLHTVDGRDREIAEALSRLAAHGDPAALPTVLR